MKNQTLSETVIDSTRGRAPVNVTAIPIDIGDATSPTGPAAYRILCTMCLNTTTRFESYFVASNIIRCPSCLAMQKVES